MGLIILFIAIILIVGVVLAFAVAALKSSAKKRARIMLETGVIVSEKEYEQTLKDLDVLPDDLEAKDLYAHLKLLHRELAELQHKG